MAKPDKLNIIWARTGTSVDPGDTKFELGWVAEIPPYQYFNYVLNKHSAMLDHVNTYGIPEWDVLTEYKLGSKVLYSGIEYTCKVASSIGAVPTSLVDWNNTESNQPTNTTSDVNFAKGTFSGNITQPSGVTSLKDTTITSSSSTSTLIIDSTSGSSGLNLRSGGITKGFAFYNSANDTVNFGGGSTNNTLSIFKATSNLVYGLGVDNGIDLLQVGSNTDISASLGNIQFFGSSGRGYITAYGDSSNLTDYAIRLGFQTQLNAKVGQLVRILNGGSDTIAEFEASAISLLKPVTITETATIGGVELVGITWEIATPQSVVFDALAAIVGSNRSRGAMGYTGSNDLTKVTRIGSSEFRLIQNDDSTAQTVLDIATTMGTGGKILVVAF